MGQPTPPRTNLPVPAGRVPPGPKVPAPRAPLPGLPRVPAGLPGTVAGYVIGTIATPSIVNILERAVRYDLVTEWQAEGRARRKGPTKRTARRRADRGTTALLRAQAGLQTAPAPTRPAERAPPRLRSARVKVPKYRPNLAGIPMPTPTIPRPAPTVSSVLASTPTWAREALIGGALALATSSSSRRARARAQEPLIPSLPPGLTDPLTGFQPGTVPFPSSGFAGDSGLPPGTPGTHTCECKPKRKRKPSKPRTRCYRGSFTETRRGTRKYSKVRIPCQ